MRSALSLNAFRREGENIIIPNFVMFCVECVFCRCNDNFGFPID